MLYKKNLSKELSEELFKSPTSEYRGTPFWAWNCKMTPEILEKQIEYLMNVIKTQQGTIINQQAQVSKEYVVISMFDGILGLKTRPEQTAPAIKLHFKETYIL